jgi:hypothetical protein
VAKVITAADELLRALHAVWGLMPLMRVHPHAKVVTRESPLREGQTQVRVSTVRLVIIPSRALLCALNVPLESLHHGRGHLDAWSATQAITLMLLVQLHAPLAGLELIKNHQDKPPVQTVKQGNTLLIRLLLSALNVRQDTSLSRGLPYVTVAIRDTSGPIQRKVGRVKSVPTVLAVLEACTCQWPRLVIGWIELQRRMILSM